MGPAEEPTPDRLPQKAPAGPTSLAPAETLQISNQNTIWRDDKTQERLFRQRLARHQTAPFRRLLAHRPLM